jgi:hypothetical protein
MSDYLESLIAKSLGLVDTIQPRLPSLFEPIQASIATDSPKIILHGSKKTMPNEKPEDSTDIVRGTSPELSSGDHFKAEFSHRESPPFIYESTSEKNENADSDKISISLSSIKKPLLEPITSSEELKQSIPPTKDFGGVKSASIHPVENLARSAKLKVSKPEISVLIGQITRMSSPKWRGTEQIHQKGEDPKIDSQNINPEPKIHVKIGRIEVRAVNSEQPVYRPKRASSSPLLTLEEYQRQRKGGLR